MLKKYCQLPLITIFVCAGIFSGCWIPEEFDASVRVREDGSFTFRYDGILTIPFVLAAAKEGSLSQEDEKDFAAETAAILKEPGFKQVEYLGKGRYQILFEHEGKSGEKFHFSSEIDELFTVLPQKDGTVRISTTRPSKEDLDQLLSFGAKIDGTLTVVVERGIEVVEHNADEEPYLFGLLGGYSWQIQSPADDPYIVVRSD